MGVARLVSLLLFVASVMGQYELTRTTLSTAACTALPLNDYKAVNQNFALPTEIYILQIWDPVEGKAPGNFGVNLTSSPGTAMQWVSASPAQCLTYPVPYVGSATAAQCSSCTFQATQVIGTFSDSSYFAALSGAPTTSPATSQLVLTGASPCAVGTIEVPGSTFFVKIGTGCPSNICSAQTVNWPSTSNPQNGLTCMGSYPGGNPDGVGVTVVDIETPESLAQGSSMVNCLPTGQTILSNTNCTAACPAQLQYQWGAGCTIANLPSLFDGQTVNLIALDGKKGSVDVRCSGGVLIAENAVCSNDCVASSLTWTVNGVVCRTGPVTANNSRTIDILATEGPVGSASFQCNAGVLREATNSTCTDQCVARTYVWAGGCSGPYPGAASSETLAVVANAGGTGSVTLTCASGTLIPQDELCSIGGTATPTSAPTNAPTRSPTTAPTNSPTRSPTAAPTIAATGSPTTAAPTIAATGSPTTAAPTIAATGSPTTAPTTKAPTAPTAAPTKGPTSVPVPGCVDPCPGYCACANSTRFVLFNDGTASSSYTLIQGEALHGVFSALSGPGCKYTAHAFSCAISSIPAGSNITISYTLTGATQLWWQAGGCKPQLINDLSVDCE